MIFTIVAGAVTLVGGFFLYKKFKPSKEDMDKFKYKWNTPKWKRVAESEFNKGNMFIPTNKGMMESPKRFEKLVKEHNAKAEVEFNKYSVPSPTDITKPHDVITPKI